MQTKPALPAQAGLLYLWDFTCSWGALGDCIFFETCCPVRQIFAVVSLTDDAKVLSPGNRRDDYGVTEPDGGPLILDSLHPAERRRIMFANSQFQGLQVSY